MGYDPPFVTKPKKAAGPKAKEGFVEKAWQYDAAWSLIGKAAESFAGVFQRFEHSIRVVVQGGHEADIRRVWYLACSLAFGRYRNRVADTLAETTMQGVWDVARKSCAVEIFYRTNPINQVIDRSTASVTNPFAGAFNDLIVIAGIPIDNGVAFRFGFDSTKSSYAFMGRGPEQLTIGADWPTFARPKADAARLPILPRTVWAGPPCQPPGIAPGAAAIRPDIRSGTFGLPGVFREFPIVLGATGSAYPARVGALLDPVFSAAFPFYFPSTETAQPTLPDDGRVITTGDKSDPRVQPPVPHADGVGRYNTLFALVAQTLQCPCFLPTTPECTERLQANDTGLSVYAQGNETGQNNLGLTGFINAGRGINAVFDDFVEYIPDMTEAVECMDTGPTTNQVTELTGGGAGGEFGPDEPDSGGGDLPERPPSPGAPGTVPGLPPYTPPLPSST